MTQLFDSNDDCKKDNKEWSCAQSVVSQKVLLQKGLRETLGNILVVHINKLSGVVKYYISSVITIYELYGGIALRGNKVAQ